MNLRRVSIASLILLMSLSFCGTITGTVGFEGKVPGKKRLKMDADPVCGSAHSGPVYNQSFMVNDDMKLQNVMVWLKGKGLKGKSPDAAVLDQKGCVYEPHVLGLMTGQKLTIKTSDHTLHNIHSRSKVNSSFNFAMPEQMAKAGLTKDVSFDKVEEPFIIKCDVHPWMKSYVSVFDHPYFAVTDENGNFKIENVPAGDYEIMAWQEKFKTKGILSQKVSVGEGETKADFTFIRKSKKK